ncbi:MAG: 3-deoxy-manno-octulosonate cytidylyltransferase [Alphaproteobacteria bacterium]|nr:MAG: 3-deoxy-manno-octulosonate cytidylyltransferase [Alphaproteobacteria bacterium]
MKIAVGIPARMGSTRFPGKPLAKLAGRPMIEHVIEQAVRADLGPVFVATDDERIADVVRETGAQVVMTRSDHRSGSERLAEAAGGMDCDVIVNVQGDEPLIDPAAIRAVVQPFYEDVYLPMATLAHPLQDSADLNDSNVVKLVVNAKGRAMYFSRAPIPYPRSGNSDALQHVGLYAYRREFLLIYPSLSPCEAEKAEQLEQLRVLYHGYDIAVTVGDYHCIGVDTPEDLQRAERLLAG